MIAGSHGGWKMNATVIYGFIIAMELQGIFVVQSGLSGQSEKEWDL